MESDSNRLIREIVCRGSLILFGALLIFGALQFLRYGDSIAQDGMATGDPSALPDLIGLALFAVGGFFVLAALTPVRMLERLFPPPQFTAFDGPEERPNSGLRWLMWWRK